jgi:uncharacterized zinc-type alcohol dehydrogenase-like protein
MVDSCGTCGNCVQDHEQHCIEGPTYTYNGKDRHDGSITYGGYSNLIVVAEHFVFSLPRRTGSVGGRSLLCAGITTWEPLHKWKVGRGSRVAVVGLGGLGHMALKLAKALGAETRSSPAGQEEDARALGVDHVVLSTDAAQMQAATASL